MRDRLLVEKVLAGDRNAASRFVDDHYPSVQKFLFFLSGSQEESIELSQTTFLRVRQALAGFRYESSLKVWIRRIAYTEFLKSQRRPTADSLSGLEDLPGPDGLSADALVIADALGSLSDEHREAFVLREIDGLSVDEAAAVLGVPAGTVKSRCHLAKRALRRRLASAWGHESEQRESYANIEALSTCDPCNQELAAD